MTNYEFYLHLEDSLLELRTQINHARVIMQDVMEMYFHNIYCDPKSDEGARFIVHDFDNCCIHAEIVEDAIYHMHGALLSIENTCKLVTEDEQA